MNQPQRAGRAGGTILQAFLFLFAITNLLTLILTVVNASKYQYKKADLFFNNNDPKPFSFPGNGSWPFSFPGNGDSWPFGLDDVDIGTVFESIRLHLGSALVQYKFLGDSSVPYVLLAVHAGITWVITSIALLFLFTRIRYFNHRVARYVFRVIGVATSIFLVIFYLTWANTYNFVFPFAFDWPLGKGAAIMAHINLVLGIFITLLAAALDTPKDWDAPTGPNSRRTSQV
ncbi:hypothetical protein FPHYL_9767 [Fusarium phyllophilum]|uniref:Uncharacterized protein n=1 Tax=Fusarium phyllophilum TaxID=47803 RepID=A0A8H5J5Y1_9HYPO|nr:hypothetical protein FPHYL_9767 [Fusarium phyllophilum]